MKSLVVGLTWLVLVACSGKPPAPRQSSGWFRAVLTNAQGIEFPFLLHLGAGSGKATIVNGSVQLDVDASVTGERVELVMAVFHSRLTAARVGNRLTGTFEAMTSFGGTTSMSFAATEIDEPNLVPATGSGEPTGASSGWRIQLAENIGKVTVREHAQHRLSAVLTMDTGDITYFGGSGSPDQLVLAGFDGTGVFRLDWTLPSGKNTGRGRWISGQAGESIEEITVTRDDAFVLPPHDRIDDGRKLELPQLDAFAGKPVLLELGGSWCATCRLAAPFLVELFRAHHPEGLEMMTLLYEFSTDPGYNAKQVDLFVKTYGILWPVIAMPGEVADLATLFPTTLGKTDISGLPVAIFLDASHTIRGLHVGFPSPNDEATYLETRHQFETMITKVLH